MSIVDTREDLTLIARAAIASVDPRAIVRDSLRLEGNVLHIDSTDAHHALDLREFGRIFVLGFGKASAPMAQVVEEVLGRRIERGLIVVKPGHEMPLERILQVRGGHPVPDQSSALAASQIAALADQADERTLVVTLISGGGSSLLAAPLPHDGSSLEISDIQETTRQLLACGAAIQEMNCIRKHLLLLAGGRLVSRAAPATCVSLVLSDVVGDDLQTIASGPTCADTTTYAQALAIIDSYGIAPSLPAAVIDRLERGSRGEIPETPKPGSPGLEKAMNVLVGTNLHALAAARAEAERRGYETLILTTRMTGESREVARVIAAVAKDVCANDLPVSKPACVLCGGETMVTIRGKGRGGRNQEMALAFLREIQNDPDTLARAAFLAFSTDGEDGPTEAAGGFADLEILKRAISERLTIVKYLHDNDSNTILRKLDALFVTGPTNTNVCDIQVVLVR